MRNLKLMDGEYEIVEDLHNGVFECYRKGEKWRDLTGDNMVLALVDELDKYKHVLEGVKRVIDREPLEDLTTSEDEIDTIVSRVLED